MKKIIITSLIIFQTMLSNAQINFKSKILNENKNVVIATFIENPQKSIENTLIEINESKNKEYKLLKSFKDELNVVHNHYQEYYKGFLVLNATYAVSIQNGKILMINGYSPLIDDLKIKKGKLNQTEIIPIAKKYFFEKTKDNLKTIESTMILAKGISDESYQFAYYLTLDNDRYNAIVVSAQDGTILQYETKYCFTNAPGSGSTLYSGAQNFITDMVTSNSFRLRENRAGVNISILNMSGVGDWENTGSATDFFDNDNNWTLSEHLNNRSAIEAKWAMGKILDYWKLYRQRNSFDNTGGQVICYMHSLFPAYIGQDNALWKPSTSTMHFADGNIWGPHSSLDIISHEFAHGVCQYTAGLLHGNAESGALNEGFSDIWGAVIEAWAAPTKSKWFHAEDIKSGAPLRNLQDPNNAYFVSPDTYKGNYWDFGGEPHYNSTVLSHWFYLVSEGGSGINDIGNSYNVNGISIDNAAKITYLTETNLSPTANYLEARNVSIQMARNVFGIGSCEEIAVTKAWYAVGVGANYSGSIPSPVISGNDALCANGTGNYTINGSSNCLIGVTNVWSITKADGSSTTATVSPLTGNNTTVTIPSNLTTGALKLTATLSNGSIVNKIIHIGSPYFGATYKNGKTDGLPPAIYFPNQPPENFNNVCIGYGFPNVYIDAQPVGTNNVAWSFANGFPSTTMSMQQTVNRAYFGWNFAPPNPPLYLQATVNNSCGSYSQIFAFKQVNCGTTTNPCALTSVFTISPNPTNGFVKIGIEGRPPPPDCLTLQALYNSKEGVSFNKVNIYNQMGSLLKTQNFVNTKQANISLQNLVAGTYRVEIIGKDGYKETKNIVVQK